MHRLFSAALLFLSLSRPAAGGEVPRVRLDLTDAGSGRTILSCVLGDGERAVLTWTNSLFGLKVTEVFVARAGGLELTSVTFADPEGGDPPLLKPEDLDDVYHTGGPFRVEGLSRAVRRVVFRVGEIGRPTLSVGDRSVRFVEEVGFGGAIVMRAASSTGDASSEPGPGPDPGGVSCPAS